MKFLRKYRTNLILGIIGIAFGLGISAAATAEGPAHMYITMREPTSNRVATLSCIIINSTKRQEFR